MAIRLSNVRLTYDGSYVGGVFRFFDFVWRINVISLASQIVLFSTYNPAAGGGTTPLQYIIINTDGSVYWRIETSPLFAGLEWERTTDPGFITTGSWISLVFIFDGSAQRMYKDNVEATYASTNTGGASPTDINSSSTHHIGGFSGTVESEFDLAEMAIYDGGTNAIVNVSDFRAILVDGWDPGFFFDYVEGGTDRPGQMFYIKATGDLSYNSNLLPINELNDEGPSAVSGTPSWVEHPFLIEPASVRLESEADYPTVEFSVPQMWFNNVEKLRARYNTPITTQPYFSRVPLTSETLLAGGRRKVGPPRRPRPDTPFPVGRGVRIPKYEGKPLFPPYLTKRKFKTGV